MEMSNAYLNETVEALAHKGFVRTTTPLSHLRDDVVVFTGSRHLLEAPGERLALECLQYADGSERYYLEIMEFHGLMIYPFELDSWKHRDNRVEFKFCAPADTGVGLSFILELPRPNGPTAG